MRALTLYVDGASKGNPGHAGIGIQIVCDGEVLHEHAEYLGQATNNSAEYRALIKGLELASAFKADRVSVISDSELMVRQMNGQYRVKNPALLPLFQEARKRSRAFGQFAIRHVPRAENKAADRLANEGIIKGKSETSGPDGRALTG